jgi:hypothetical protein
VRHLAFIIIPAKNISVMNEVGGILRLSQRHSSLMKLCGFPWRPKPETRITAEYLQAELEIQVTGQ